MVLIDTPGIGSTYRHNTTATLNFLQQCDAALFLVSADPPITEVELEFLKQVKDKVPRLFFVLNKIDYLNGDELEEALSFYKKVLAEEKVWDADTPVFCVSARSGLEAKSALDSDQWTASGMAQLESFLTDFLARDKFNALTVALSRRAEELIAAVLMESAIALQALQTPRQELEEKLILFESSLKKASNERRLIQDVLEGDKKRVTAFVEGLVRRNVENIRWSMLQNLNVSFAGFARKIRERLDETVAATKGAMESARQRRQADNGSIDVEVTRMTGAMGTLEQLSQELRR